MTISRILEHFPKQLDFLKRHEIQLNSSYIFVQLINHQKCAAKTSSCTLVFFHFYEECRIWRRGFDSSGWVSLTRSYSGGGREWEEVQHYCIDYFQLYFHLTLALDHLYRQSFRDLHYLSSSSAAAINLALDLSLFFWHTMFTLIIKGHSHIKTQFAYCPINSYDFRVNLSPIELSWNSITHFTSSPNYKSCILWTTP